MAELNDRQRAFALEYLKDKNATQAAIRAGYSENSAYSIGSELLKKPEIAEFLQSQENAIVTDLRERFADKAERAFKVLSDLMEGVTPPGVKKPSARTVADVAMNMLDRAGYTVTTKIAAEVENSGKVEVFLNVPQPKVDK